MDRMLKQIQINLKRGDKCQDAAAFLSSKFLTRPEIVTNLMPEFLDWAMQIIAMESKDRIDDIAKMGALKSVSYIYKHGKREDMLPYASTVLKVVQEAKLETHSNVVIQRLGVKLVQRLGLTFLKAKIASWRYQRGSRSLAMNLDDKKDAPKKSKQENNVNEEDEDYDIPDEIEEVIEYLLEGLKSPETVIRWSAAKGIGRVTGRLPKELADEVVESLLGLLNLKSNDSGWHGSCLSLAELARRGLLLPKRLDVVVDNVLKALVYDERRGCFSVGAHVRDAACYVCWAFARAYTPEVLRSFVADSLAPALLVTAVFDREVNCRRAASAAFQEIVGRLGADAVPHGIELLTTCDYHSVGLRAVAYTELSVKVAQTSELYARKLVEHLIEQKISHWDNSVRELTGQALRKLAPITPDLIINTVIPNLLDNLDETKDLYTRHGSLVAVGGSIIGLADSIKKEGKSLQQCFDEKTLERLKNILMVLEQRMMLRGSAGELLRSAVTPFIQNMSEAHFPCHNDPPIIDLWKMIIDDNLAHKDPLVQERAIQSVASFVNEYFTKPETLDHLLEHYMSSLDQSELHRRGFALALGSLPKTVLQGRLDKVLSVLIEKTKITKATEVWAEARRDVIKAIINIIKTMGVSKGHNGESSICEANIVPIYECFLLALEDYTHDRRGDIGAWVREASMSGLTSLTLLASKESALVPQVCVEAMMPKIAQQALEKIDRTRGHAAHLFATLVTSKDVQYIPHKDQVLQCFPEKIRQSGSDFDEFGWSVESQTFPIFAKLLRLKSYTKATLLGLIVSVGGVTERLVRQSSLSLFEELQRMKSAELTEFGQIFLNLFRQYQKIDRITLPILKCLDQLLTSGNLKFILGTDFAFDLFTLVKTEITKCGEPNKLVSSIDVFCNLLQADHEVTVQKCFIQISIFLCHKFPRIRKVTATKLFETLLVYDVIEDDEIKDQVDSILSDTNWDLPVEELRPIRNRFCDLVGVQAPALIKKPL